MQSKHNLFKYSLKEAIINSIKIKSSDQMFTACVCIGDCLLLRSFSTGAEMSWCRAVFFNGCRTVLFPQRPEWAEAETESEIITSLDQIILSFRKPFLSFCIYLSFR
jgi:hypothetical protein